jgi:hypothetical protein
MVYGKCALIVAARERVKWMHWTFRFCLINFFVNIAAVIILGASGGRSMTHLIFSILGILHPHHHIALP